MRYTVTLEEDRDGELGALCPELSGWVSQGQTRTETLEDMGKAMETSIEALLEDGSVDPVPEREDWPSDFWQAFEGMPEDFERPGPLPVADDPGALPARPEPA